MNYSLENIANATTVPLGPSGSGHKGITVHADNFGTDLVLDVYGYYVTHAAPPCFDDANRYVDCGNGTVTDTVTGLIWLKNANCFSTMTYAAANQAAALLAAGQCGLTDGSSAGDWRLPTQTEWSITTAHAGPPPFGLGCTNPSLTNDPGNACFSAGPTSFTGVQSSAHWSSQGADGAPSLAYLHQPRQRQHHLRLQSHRQRRVAGARRKMRDPESARSQLFRMHPSPGPRTGHDCQ